MPDKDQPGPTYGTFSSRDDTMTEPSQDTTTMTASGPTGEPEPQGPRQRRSDVTSAPHQTDDVTPTSNQTDDVTASGQSGFKLRREVGLLGSISLILGSIIGSGIFVSPKGVLDGVGSVGLSLVIWALCGVISMVGSFGLVELGTCIRKSGGDYTYVLEAYGGAPGFLYAWLSILFLRPAGGSIMALTCAEYVLAPFFKDSCGGQKELLTKMVAVAVIMTILGINVYSVKLANRVGIVFTFTKVVALGIIIVGGIVLLIQGNTKYLTNSFEGTTTDVSRLALGFYSGMWAYDGWNNLNYSTEEVENPVKNLPRAIIIAVPLCTICYVLVNLSYFTILSPADIIASPAVAVTWAERVMPGAWWLFPLFVGISTFGSAHASLFSGGRVAYVAARNGHMVGVFSMVDTTNYTPSASLIFTCLMAIIMALPSNIGQLINYFSFTAWIWYGAVALALLVLRYRQPDIERPYRVPLVFPIVTFFVSAFLVIGPLIQDPKIEFLYATLSIFAGLIFYIPLVYFEKKVPGTDTVTKWMQLALQVAPPTSEPDY